MEQARVSSRSSAMMSAMIWLWFIFSAIVAESGDRCPIWASGAGVVSCSGNRIGQIFVGVTTFPPGWTSQWHVRALGLEPSQPGQNWIFKLNCERYSDQCAWWRVSFLVDMKYSKFLWSVMVSIGSAQPSR